VRRRLLAGLAVALAAALTLSGCSMGGWVYNADLPGGAKLGSDPITLTADFSDVLDLVPQSSVRLNNVAVGRVSKITLEPDGHSAQVTLEVNRDAALMSGTTARIEQTSLLGEKYVALVPPATTAAAGSPLPDGSRLPLASTSEAVDVEQVLGALSLVLNGGGIGQFQEISRELQKIGDGRTGQIRDFLDQVDRLVSGLNSRKDAITSALDGLDRLATVLQGQDDKISTALDGLSPGMKVLAEQRPQLVAMLSSLDKLSDITVSTLDRSQKDMIADFKTLDPILTQLAKSGSDLPDSLQILLTYPFPDSVLGAIQGDYLNVFMTTNFRTVPTGCAKQGCSWPQVGSAVSTSSSTSGSAGTRGHAVLPPGTDAPPTLLPPTDSPLPGAPSSSVPGGDLLAGTPSKAPSGSASGSASPGGSGSTDQSDQSDQPDPPHDPDNPGDTDSGAR
jgi:phospholipid/cholesterol/gamma-HCH transport system substrate-binding protein